MHKVIGVRMQGVPIQFEEMPSEIAAGVAHRAQRLKALESSYNQRVIKNRQSGSKRD